jgi:hypothetical protein
VLTKVTIWGVPADPGHDAERGLCITVDNPSDTCPATAPPVPFFSLPTSCAGEPQNWNLRADSWQSPTVDHTAVATTGAITGCENVPFNAALTARPTVSTAGEPTGLAVKLTTPQNANPFGLAQAHLRTAEVQLPEGTAISPSSADGLSACTDEQIALRSAAASTCPAAAKIGTVAIDTPLLDEPLRGSVYVGSQKSPDPLSGEMFRLFIEARDDERGVTIKLPGEVRADPATGV